MCSKLKRAWGLETCQYCFHDLKWSKQEGIIISDQSMSLKWKQLLVKVTTKVIKKTYLVLTVKGPKGIIALECMLTIGALYLSLIKRWDAVKTCWLCKKA